MTVSTSEAERKRGGGGNNQLTKQFHICVSCDASGGGPESLPAPRRRLAAPAAGEKSVICQKGVLISRRRATRGGRGHHDIALGPKAERDGGRGSHSQSVENFRSFCRDISCLSRRSDVYHVAFDSSALKITTSSAAAAMGIRRNSDSQLALVHYYPSATYFTQQRQHNCRLKAVIKEAFKLMTPPLCLARSTLHIGEEIERDM